MNKLDYHASADLFPARNALRLIGYRRFDSVAEAIRYAVEEMPEKFFNGTVLESAEVRLNSENIRTAPAATIRWHASHTLRRNDRAR
jgi:Arc/MetJ-type ribon-helix-helix transcriptional regulator